MYNTVKICIKQSDERTQVYDKTAKTILTLAVTSFPQKVLIQASLMTASLLCCKYYMIVCIKYVYLLQLAAKVTMDLILNCHSTLYSHQHDTEEFTMMLL